MQTSKSKAVPTNRLGLLDKYMPGFHSMLLAQGYSNTTLHAKLKMIFNFNKWLMTRDIKPYKINENVIKIFFKEQPRSGYIRRGDLAALNALLKYLQDSGIAPKKVDKIVHDDIQRIMCDFAEYLEKERGLAQASLNSYLPIILRFLNERFGKDPVFMHEITLRNVTHFVVRCSRLWTPKRSQLMTSALRSFFRYLRFHGD